MFRGALPFQFPNGNCRLFRKYIPLYPLIKLSLLQKLEFSSIEMLRDTDFFFAEISIPRAKQFDLFYPRTIFSGREIATLQIASFPRLGVTKSYDYRSLKYLYVRGSIVFAPVAAKLLFKARYRVEIRYDKLVETTRVLAENVAY